MSRSSSGSGFLLAEGAPSHLPPRALGRELLPQDRYLFSERARDIVGKITREVHSKDKDQVLFEELDKLAGENCVLFKGVLSTDVLRKDVLKKGGWRIAKEAYEGSKLTEGLFGKLGYGFFVHGNSISDTARIRKVTREVVLECNYDQLCDLIKMYTEWYACRGDAANQRAFVKSVEEAFRAVKKNGGVEIRNSFVMRIVRFLLTIVELFSKKYDLAGRQAAEERVSAILLQLSKEQLDWAKHALRDARQSRVARDILGILDEHVAMVDAQV